MFDIKLIRENLEDVKRRLASKNAKVNLDEIAAKDAEIRALLKTTEDLRSEQNRINDGISQLLKEKKPAQDLIGQMKAISSQIKDLEPKLKELQDELHRMVLFVPNAPHASVPVGNAEKNTVVRTWGDPKTFDFTPKNHVDIAEQLDIVDFKRSSKLSGSHFILFKNEGARLERALYNFMLDYHTTHHGYREVFTPFLVNAESMTATGQLPKMAEDMYRLKDDDLYLIPTAEVPVTNIHRDEILNEEQLPVYYAAYSACFRREAGAYGKDTKGMIRVHQFDKVELVKFVKPETSYEELEKLVGNAEKILQLLKLPYRVLMLASGDMSFAAAKCYDLEAFAPGQSQWLEVSSCSNFEDFQARRANIRYKGASAPKPVLVHTLNGSGLALARIFVAILENYQTEDGSVVIPEVLRPYMGGMEKISRKF